MTETHQAYRAKSFKVTAHQITSHDILPKDGVPTWPDWVQECWARDLQELHCIHPTFHNLTGSYIGLFLTTVDGYAYLNPSDWLVRGEDSISVFSADEFEDVFEVAA